MVDYGLKAVSLYDTFNPVKKSMEKRFDCCN